MNCTITSIPTTPATPNCSAKRSIDIGTQALRQIRPVFGTVPSRQSKAELFDNNSAYVWRKKGCVERATVW